MSPEEELLRRGIDAFNEGDVATFSAIFAADAVVHGDPRVAERMVYHGRDGVRAWFEEAGARWEQTRFIVRSVEPSGAGAVVEANLIGRAPGGAGGAWRLIVAMWVSEGLITRIDVADDRATAERLLGGAGPA